MSSDGGPETDIRAERRKGGALSDSLDVAAADRFFDERVRRKVCALSSDRVADEVLCD